MSGSPVVLGARYAAVLAGLRIVFPSDTVASLSILNFMPKETQLSKSSFGKWKRLHFIQLLLVNVGGRFEMHEFVCS